ncbi:hypothetical protein TNCV_4556381 [Trichonephila clavipes]|nr:hypothetical protein TNCV_4556381 [Trichonephila clavipes]
MPVKFVEAQSLLVDTYRTLANIFNCPAVLAALQEINVLFSSANLKVDNIEQIAKVIWVHGAVRFGPVMDISSSTLPYKATRGFLTTHLFILYLGKMTLFELSPSLQTTTTRQSVVFSPST